MAQPRLENRTHFAAEALFLTDEHGQPVVTLAAKATYVLSGQGLSLAGEQAPLWLEGELWGEDSAQSSYRYEPECASFKPGTDVVLVGHAHPPDARTREFLVRFQVGPLRKEVRVVGDRTWYKSLGSLAMTPPRPVERIPLCYERAFGGWDRSHPDSARHTFEPRNPVGRGFRGPEGRFEEGVLLPNLEDPAHALTSFRQTPPPAGFGFLSPHWLPRARLAGTHDAAWERERKPLPPRDYDPRFMNAASPGLVATGYLRGNEAVVVENASPDGRLVFSLPGLPPPAFKVSLKGHSRKHGVLNLDTLIVDTDAARVYLHWRACVPLRSGPLDVFQMELRPGSSAPV
ncbi:DUF2169 domain-containing protein [Pyxidicoccus parkwayensis]|uniref:DUF2169 domain-containing protein n=1 Tax=Pyxidicoccus parkwayensis TaxID=2813578 RepID=A0ABX7NND1_9BACT|nr:DUF2169 domain-containing protein [Pyxidicoccus parkwaysis]QSQ19027.1 DUF2169 domain-containing protein [Pyxidicoccus parkwaysis]